MARGNSTVAAFPHMIMVGLMYDRRNVSGQFSVIQLLPTFRSLFFSLRSGACVKQLALLIVIFVERCTLAIGDKVSCTSQS